MASVAAVVSAGVEDQPVRIVIGVAAVVIGIPAGIVDGFRIVVIVVDVHPVLFDRRFGGLVGQFVFRFGPVGSIGLDVESLIGLFAERVA